MISEKTIIFRKKTNSKIEIWDNFIIFHTKNRKKLIFPTIWSFAALKN